VLRDFLKTRKSGRHRSGQERIIVMGFSHRILASACLAVLTSGCATFGTNIEGDFTCRAPKGDCAPSQVIDAKRDQGFVRDRTGP
jgi:hypothetical protein